MKKITKAFKGLLEIIKKPYLLNLILNEEEKWRKKAENEFGFKYGFPVVKITDFLSEDFSIDVSPYAFLDGSCTPLDLALLKGVAIKYNIKKYLEIGTWRGESVANVASVVPKCTTINLPDEKMRKAGMTEDYINVHRVFSQKISNVKHIQADSADFDFNTLEKNFDMVFIDGDHHSEHVKKDTKKIFEFIDAAKTIIVWHDYSFNPERPRWSVMYGILAGCPSQYHENIVHISNTLCAVYLPDIKKSSFEKKSLQPDCKPEFYFDINIKSKKFNS